MSESPYIVDVTRETFSSVVLQGSQRLPVLADFWADWCGPCKTLIPLLETLAREYDGKFLLAKINSDEQQELAAQYGVRSLPTVKVFLNGEIVDEFMGAQPESVVRDIIERYLEKPADSIRLQAEQALQRGDSNEALELLLQAQALDPGDAGIALELAAAQLQAGHIREADTLLNGLPADIMTESAAKGLRTQVDLALVLEEAPEPAEVAQQVQENPGNLAARQQLAAYHILAGEYESGLEQLYEIMRADRSFGDDAGRRGMIGVFELLGNQGELVRRFRRRISSLLF